MPDAGVVRVRMRPYEPTGVPDLWNRSVTTAPAGAVPVTVKTLP